MRTTEIAVFVSQVLIEEGLLLQLIVHPFECPPRGCNAESLVAWRCMLCQSIERVFEVLACNKACRRGVRGVFAHREGVGGRRKGKNDGVGNGGRYAFIHDQKALKGRNQLSHFMDVTGRSPDRKPQLCYFRKKQTR